MNRGIDNKKSGKTVSLVLGSGGARGYAHIGVIEVLLERGYEIVAISGCSMGAMVAGIYAAGKLQPFKDWATGLDYLDVLRLLDLTLASPGALRGEKVFSVVKELIQDIRIEDLPIPYTAVATDLIKQREIWFQEGLLHQAIRASVAIPSVITPMVMDGRVLVDGGLLNPLPILPVISARSDLIIAVDLNTADAEHPCNPSITPAVSGDSTFDAWFRMLRNKAASIFDRGGSSDSTATEKDPEGEGGEKREKGAADVDVKMKPDSEEKEAAPVLDDVSLGKLDIINLTFSTMQANLTQYKLAGYPPDVLITVPRMEGSSYDYHKAPEFIKIGREETEATLDRLKGQECP